jgi:hypothetical protein
MVQGSGPQCAGVLDGGAIAALAVLNVYLAVEFRKGADVPRMAARYAVHMLGIGLSGIGRGTDDERRIH